MGIIMGVSQLKRYVFVRGGRPVNWTGDILQEEEERVNGSRFIRCPVADKRLRDFLLKMG